MTPRLQGEEWRVLAQYIYSICGIQLDESKQYLIESRLSGLIRQARAGGFSDLYYRARADPSKRIERQIIDAITTGETSFFRDKAPFDLLRAKLIPELLDRRSRQAPPRLPIRVWSAACSTGQELYSIAITIRDLMGDGLNYDVRLLGTDISERAVARASSGLYREIEVERGGAGVSLSRYFTRHPEGWKIADEIRVMASFKTINLLQDFSALGQFDLIFCRNVAIYFSVADRVSLFGRIWKALAPGGRLLIGSTESLVGILPSAQPQRHCGAVFYERPLQPT